MDIKSKILLGIFILAAIASITLTYRRVFVAKSYEVVQAESAN